MSGVNNPDKKSNLDSNDSRPFEAMKIAWELGYTITVPIILLALLGRFADKYFDTSPRLLLLGIIASITISSFIIFKKIAKIL